MEALSAAQVQELSAEQYQSLVPAGFATITARQIGALLPDGKRDFLRLAALAKEHPAPTRLDPKTAKACARALGAFTTQLERSELFHAESMELTWAPELAARVYGRWPLIPAMQFRLTEVGQTESEENPLVQLAANVGAFFAEAKGEDVFSGAARYLSVRPTVIGKAARTLLDATPVVGNLLSLYTALSGKSAFSGEMVSDAERALSVLGTVPGAGVLLKVAGRSSAVVVRNLITQTRGLNLEKASEFAEVAVDLMEVVESDAAQRVLQRDLQLEALTEALLAPFLDETHP